MSGEEPAGPEQPDFQLAPTVIVPRRGSEDFELYPVGARIDDRYKVVDVRGGRGRSGMGIVYIVEEDDGRLLAAKTFQRRFARDLPLIQRFVREAQTWMRVGFHPNVTRALRLEMVKTVPYLIMEFVPSDGAGHHSLADRFAAGPLSVEASLDWAIQCCDGMVHAEAAVPGLVHRDIKPDNLLMTPEGVLKITDFGLVLCRELPEAELARLAGELPEGDNNDLTDAGTVFGTPAYMAPEQFTDAAEVTLAADVYALGCCLYESLTGRPPFKGEGASSAGRLISLRRMHRETPPPAIRYSRPDCPAALDRLVARCLAKKPGKRFESFAEVRGQLLSIWHDEVGPEPRVVHASEPTPREVAAQLRSMALLEGYDRAIRLRNLRESQESSPYDFHLALAAYFHCHGDPREERRQLEKALRARSDEEGYEAARRLGELLVSHGELETARSVLGTFLEEHTENLERVLEPWVRLLVAEKKYAEAEGVLAPLREGRRTQLLQAELLAAAGRADERRALLERLLDRVLAGVERKLDSLTPGDRMGCDYPDDAARLEEALTCLRPDLDCAVLQVADLAVWPDVTGYPDFAPDLAWLSFVLGELGKMASPPEFTYYAHMLGYPGRLAMHRERDEYWLWLRDSLAADPTEEAND